MNTQIKNFGQYYEMYKLWSTKCELRNPKDFNCEYVQNFQSKVIFCLEFLGYSNDKDFNVGWDIGDVLTASVSLYNDDMLGKLDLLNFFNEMKKSYPTENWFCHFVFDVDGEPEFFITSEKDDIHLNLGSIPQTSQIQN